MAMMRCPLGVAQNADGSVDRCAESGPVKNHPTLATTMIMQCPVHGEVLFNPEVWKDEIR